MENTCPVCLDITSIGIQLCVGLEHPGSGVCIICAYQLVNSDHQHCPVCRCDLKPSIRRELQGIRIPAALPPSPPGIQDVRTAMVVGESNPNVRRRLSTEMRGIIRVSNHNLVQFISDGRRICGVRLGTQVLNFHWNDIRYDQASPEARFIMCNGVDCTMSSEPGRNSGFTIQQGGLQRYTHYLSTHDDHLPPIIMGPLFHNNPDKIPNWARQQVLECKLFYLRDQRARSPSYDPWKYGYRPCTSSRDEARQHADVTDIFTDSISVSRPFFYQSCGEHANTFRSLAFAWALEIKLIPTMRSLGQHPRDFIDISPVWSSRSRSNHDVGYSYCEFDMICALSYRKPHHKWRTGPLLFLSFRKINGNWGISGDSCALFCSPETPHYSRDFPYRGLADEIEVFYNNLP